MSKNLSAIRIFVADDHPVIRTGLKGIISKTPDLCVVGEAKTGDEVIDWFAENECDIVILDISMPGPQTIDIINELRRINPRVHILIYTIHPEDEYAMRFLNAGVSGYLTKNCMPDELKRALRKISKGGKYVSPAFSEKMLYTLGDDAKPPHERLSRREYQVFQFIAASKPVSDIAESLNISVKTVHTYRSRILQKMQLKNNAELTHYAIKHGLEAT